MAKDTTWDGGFVRTNSKGQHVYVIQQAINGKRWKKSLGVVTKHEALAEWVRFRENPAAYCNVAPDDATAEIDEPLYLDAQLVAAYMLHASAPRSDNGKENSRKWMKEKKKLLEWWAERLVDTQGRALDLRHVRLARHVLPVLDGIPGEEPGTWKVEPSAGKRHKREAIKALYAWLRKTGRITTADDPVMSLPVGQGRVAQTEGGKDKVVPREHVLKVIEYLGKKKSRYAHVLTVQAATGWHITEVSRFVAGGVIEPVPAFLAQPGVVAILVGPKHKNGKRHFAKVGERAAFSARLLLDDDAALDEVDGRAGFYRGRGEEAGGISIRHYVIAVKDACDKVKVPRFSPAWMRHTNATHALQHAGVTPDDAGKFLGHADGLMAGTVYGVNAVPPKVPTIMDDPPPNPAAKKPRRRRTVRA